jgi:hypothetical protein
MAAEIRRKNSSKKTDTQTSPKIDTRTTSTKPIISETQKNNTQVNDQGKTILKPVKPLEPIDVFKVLPSASSIATKDANSRVDDVLDIARRVAEAKPVNFDLVFEMAMKVYIMSTFRSSNNMAIEVSA